MCLYVITPPPSDSTPKYGYKIFNNFGSNLFGLFYTVPESGYKKDVWYNNRFVEPLETNISGQVYNSGFHVYLNREDAQKRLNQRLCITGLTIEKVEVDDVQTWGTEHGKIVFVCGRIKICA